MLKDAGFVDVLAEDRTNQVCILFPPLTPIFDLSNADQYRGSSQFLSVLQTELDATEADEEEFVRDFSQVRTLYFRRASSGGQSFNLWTEMKLTRVGRAAGGFRRYRQWMEVKTEEELLGRAAVGALRRKEAVRGRMEEILRGPIIKSSLFLPVLRLCFVWAV